MKYLNENGHPKYSGDDKYKIKSSILNDMYVLLNSPKNEGADGNSQFFRQFWSFPFF